MNKPLPESGIMHRLNTSYRKRAVIESVNDFLKNICQVEHGRHRSPVNFLVNLLAALSAYSFLPHKPSIRGFQDERALPLLI
jgi:hypothetical protein